MFDDTVLFLKEFRRTFHTTGAVLPSSPGLGRALARYVGQVDGEASPAERRILEVGPGTGSVTRHIVRRMTSGDRLDLVELNDRFVKRLEDLFREDKLLKRVSNRARIIHSTVQDLDSAAQYDLIVSGLPLNNFTVDEVTMFLGTFQRLLKPCGVLSFFEYVGVRTARGMVVSRPERERLQGIGRVLGDLLAKNEIRRQSVWFNVPPAWVHHVQFEREVREERLEVRG
ncbi:MAG: methyltransferase domain-containing protein [Pirellulales bacterium]